MRLAQGARIVAFCRIGALDAGWRKSSALIAIKQRARQAAINILILSRYFVN
jgi:hypothetical protein